MSELKTIGTLQVGLTRAGGGWRFAGLLAILAVAFAVSACVLPDYAAFLKANEGSGSTPVDTKMVTVSAAQITLAWDPPPEPIAQYEISCRAHGAASWTVLATIPAAATPEYTVLRSTVGAGSWDFSVVAIDGSGNRSPSHLSTDPTADPTTGWYVKWE
jgi:hypothetical protein